MKSLLSAIALLALGTSAFGSTITLNCTPTAGTNSFVNNNTVNFLNGHGTGSFSCTDAGLGAVVLNSVSIGIQSDYTAGNGTLSDPVDNSAGFTFTDGAATWANMQAGASATTMNLNTAPGVTLFVTGNFSSQFPTFNNTTSGGIGATNYVEPATDAQTGSLVGVFTIPVTGFVDHGSFPSGQSDAQVTVTYNYTAIVSGVPEPISMALVGGGLLGIALLGRRRFARK
jgi:hypothetical protein